MNLARTRSNGFPVESEYAAIGRVIADCAILEGSIHTTIRRWIKIDELIARCLIGEPTHSRLSELFSKCFEFQAMHAITDGTRTAIKSVSSEMAYIYKIRDHIAHTPCYGDGQTLTFDKTMNAKKLTQSIRYQVTTKELIALSDYTIEVAAFVQSLAASKTKDEIEFTSICAAHAASRQRSDLPKLPGEQHSQAIQKPRRQPRSSRK